MFKLTPDGTETVLHTFTGGADGGQPAGGLTQDDAGNLYGTTFYGGSSNRGTIFKLAPDGTFTVLHSFGGGRGGEGPVDPLVWNAATRNLYGTTDRLVFKLASNGEYSVLHDFKVRGIDPILSLDGRGLLYGVTYAGGGERCNCGFLFTLNRKGDATILRTFTNKNLGYSSAPPVFDGQGDLHGGGANSIYKLTQSGRFSAYRFPKPCCVAPAGDLVLDAEGTVYSAGVSSGTVFQVDADNRKQTLYKGLHNPYGLIADEDGNLYGVTLRGGAGYGTVYELAK